MSGPILPPSNQGAAQPDNAPSKLAPSAKVAAELLLVTSATDVNLLGTKVPYFNENPVRASSEINNVYVKGADGKWSSVSSASKGGTVDLTNRDLENVRVGSGADAKYFRKLSGFEDITTVKGAPAPTGARMAIWQEVDQAGAPIQNANGLPKIVVALPGWQGMGSPLDTPMLNMVNEGKQNPQQAVGMKFIRDALEPAGALGKQKGGYDVQCVWHSMGSNMGASILMELKANQSAKGNVSAISLDSYGATQAANFAMAERQVPTATLSNLTVGPMGGLDIAGMVDLVRSQQARNSVQSIHVKGSVADLGDTNIPNGGNAQIGQVSELSKSTHSLLSMSKALSNPKNLDPGGKKGE